MKIILAQGNPGQQYEKTRHNIGFIVADHFVKEHGERFVNKLKFHANIAEFILKGEKIIVVKPTTFYNDTGTSARALIDFYKIDPSKDLLVLHDELALPFGTVRTREQGRDAGNNGIKSLNSHIGPGYNRVRIGIYNDHAAHRANADFVLESFTADEREQLPAIVGTVEQLAEQFISGSFTSTKLHI